tara:strand:+ start:42053 stop:43540 length:1488 start_codon:yes stop_codon:yes gene_type:complete
MENFKAFKNKTRVEFSNITVVSGENSSGKSSVYQVLLLFAQSLGIISGRSNIFKTPNAILNLNGNYINMGNRLELRSDEGNPNLRFLIESSKKNTFEFIFRDSDYIKSNKSNEMGYHLLDFKYQSDKDNLYFRYEESSDSYDIHGARMFYFEDASTFSKIKRNIEVGIEKSSLEETEKEALLDELDYDSLFLSDVSFRGVRKVRFREGLFLDSFSIDAENIKNIIVSKYVGFFSSKDFKEVLKKDIPLRVNHYEVYLLQDLGNSFQYIPAFRGAPRRVYTEGDNPNPLFQFIDIKDKLISYRKPDDGAELFEKATVEEALTYWVCDFFKLGESIHIRELVEGYSTEIMLKKNGRLHPINQMGFGVSQVIPIIFKILTAPHGSFTIIDEPEIHLHPKMQTLLANFFVEMSTIGKIMFIETHSETFLQKLINLQIEDPKLESVLKMYWIEFSKGTSISRKVDFDSLGFFENTPEGFMDERKKLSADLNKIRKQKMGI